MLSFKKNAVTLLIIFKIWHPNLAGMENVFGALCSLVQENVTPILVTTTALAGAYWLRLPDHTAPTFNELDIVTFIPVDEHHDIPLTSRQKVKQLLNEKLDDGFYININAKKYRVQRNIPDDISKFNHTFIYAGGLSNCSHSHSVAVFRALRVGIIDGPCIVFTNPNNSRRRFNFCQEQDLVCLDCIYRVLLKKAPQIQTILFGACHGGTQILRYLAERADNLEIINHIKGAVVESPPLSVKSALQHYPFAHTFWQIILPNYDAQSKTVLNAQTFPASIHVLIASLPNDGISSLEDVKEITAHLKSCDGLIEHFVSQEEGLTHGKIGMASDYQQKLKNFYQQHNLLGSQS